VKAGDGGETITTPFVLISLECGDTYIYIYYRQKHNTNIIIQLTRKTSLANKQYTNKSAVVLT
jgi:hypothetical protein